MRFYLFEYFPWLPWALLAVALAMVGVIVLAIRTKHQTWKAILLLCLPLLILVSCAGLTIAGRYHPPLVNVSAPAPASLAVAVQVDTPSYSSQTLEALSAQTGRHRWSVSLDEGYPTSAADAQTIYLVKGTNAVAIQALAIQALDGHELWRTPLQDPAHLQQPMTVVAPPLISDDMVFINAYIGTRNAPGAVFALHANDGSLAWSLPLDGFDGNLQTRPLAVGQGLVFVGTSGGSLSAFHTSDGSLVWRQHVLPNDSQQVLPVFAAGLVYFIDEMNRSVVALHAQDGSHAWTRTLPANLLDSHFGRLSVGANSVYFESTEVKNDRYSEFLYSLNAQTGQAQWRYPLINGSGSQAVEAGDLVYYSSSTYLDAIRVSDGHRV